MAKETRHARKYSQAYEASKQSRDKSDITTSHNNYSNISTNIESRSQSTLKHVTSVKIIPNISYENQDKLFHYKNAIRSAIDTCDPTLLNSILWNKNITTELLNSFIDVGKVIIKSPQIAVLLINKGINIHNVKVEYFDTLFTYAVNNKHYDVINAIVNRQDFNINERITEITNNHIAIKPLFAYVIESQEYELAMKLLSHPNKIDIGDKYRFYINKQLISEKSILYMVVDSNNAALLAKFISYSNIAPYILNQEIKLNDVILSKNYDIAKLLIEQGIDINVKINGQSAFSYAIDNYLYPIIYALLDRKDLLFDEYIIYNSEGREVKKPILTYIIEKKHYEVALLALNHPNVSLDQLANLSIEYYHNIQNNILEVAINSKNEAIIKAVMNHPRINSAIFNNTYNISIITKDFPETTLELVKKGVNVNVRIHENDIWHKYPIRYANLLSYAIEKQNLELIDAVLKNPTIDYSFDIQNNNISKMIIDKLGYKKFIQIIQENNIADKIVTIHASANLGEVIKYLYIKNPEIFNINVSTSDNYGIARYFLEEHKMLLWLFKNGYQLHKDDELILHNLASQALYTKSFYPWITISELLNIMQNDKYLFDVNTLDEGTRIIDKLQNLYEYMISIKDLEVDYSMQYTYQELLYNNQDLVHYIPDVENKNYNILIIEALITLLRLNGSVEPQVPIASGIDRISLIYDRLDQYLPNKVTIIKMLKWLDNHYKLNNEEIDREIINFRNQNFEGLTNSVFDPYKEMSIIEVVDALSLKLHIEDRGFHINFKQLLAVIIHIIHNSEHSDILMDKLKVCLATIHLCPLGQMTMLLSVIQDEIVPENKIDYMTYNDTDEYNTTLNLALENIYNNFKDNAPLAFINWYYDHISKISPELYKDSSKKIDIIFKKAFIANNKDIITIESYHFNDGLTMQILNLLESLSFNKYTNINEFNKVQDILPGFYNIFIDGINIKITNFLSTFIDAQEAKIEDAFKNITFDENAIYGNFSLVRCKVIYDTFYAMDYNDHDKAIKFLKLLLDNCAINENTKLFIEYILINPDTTIMLPYNEDEDIVITEKTEDNLSNYSIEKDLPYYFNDLFIDIEKTHSATELNNIFDINT